MYKKILVPLDGSELAEQVLPQVIEIASRTGAEIVLLRVPDAPRYEYLMTAPGLAAGVREQAGNEEREYLAAMSLELRGLGLKVRTQMGFDDSVSSMILSTAKELGVDLIAMSTHGRSGLARLVMGSVADDVLRQAELPVLLVRPHPVGGAPRSLHKTGASQLALN